MSDQSPLTSPGGPYQWPRSPDYQTARPPEALPPRLPRIHVILFLATVLTTLVAGAMQQGINPLATPWLIYKGIPFSFTLLLILFCHEMGHYLASRWHHLDVTLPYFIPAPPIPFIIGTLGAYIRIRSPIQDKRALMDVGASGPLVGLVVTIPILALGLKFSEVRLILPGLGEPGGFMLGECLLFKLISWLVVGDLPKNYHIFLHPMAFAGWLGLFVTNLNLIPIGQLDGGHVSYALFGDRSRGIAKIFYGFLLICGLVGWVGWLVWAVLLYFMGFFHPQPLHDWLPLDRPRQWIGAITIVVFIITFTPVPMQGF
ncbi:MAG: site-2 protease family protein [Desulfobacca sp.]|nr:site-2 protease family protein [Desulfobacca sp.]